MVQDTRAPPVKVVTERLLSNALARDLNGVVDVNEADKANSQGHRNQRAE